MSTHRRNRVHAVTAALLAVGASLAAACGTPTGSERGACYPNNTCNAGLTCVSQICVRDTTADGSAGDAADAPRTETATNDVPSRNDVAMDAPIDDMVVSDAGDDTPSVDVPADAPADAPSDTPVTSDTGGGCTAAGVECSGYSTALAAAPRGATSLDNCVIQVHQSDCCGARRAYGINHAARADLCTAETACTAMYPTPASCSDGTFTTDTGETTTNMADVKLRIVSPTPCSFDMTQTCYTCETFVCTTGSCRTAPGISGGCG